MVCAHQILFSDQIKNNEIGGHVARMWDTYKKIWWGNLREREHLELLGVDGRIILNDFNDWDGIMEWIDLAQGRYRWRSLLNAAMNSQIP